MNEYIENKTYELTCISPVHIGSGETIKKYEYLYDNEKNIVLFPDKSKWINMLVKNSLLDNFLNHISNQDHLSSVNNLQWLRDNKISDKEIYQTMARKANSPVSATISKGGRKIRDNVNDIVPHISQPDGRLYIPGSSIKGVLRSGILYHLLKTKPELANEYADRIKICIKNKGEKSKKEIEKLSNELENKLINVLNIDTRSQQTKSVLKGLMVSDAMPLEPIDSIIVQKLDVVITQDGLGENSISLYRECLPVTSKFRCQISMDKNMLARLGIGSIDEIIGYARNYTKSGLKALNNVFNGRYTPLFKEAEDADFLLGGGTGFFAKTLWLAMFDDTKLVADMVKYLLFYKHKHVQKDKIISPRTLKIADNDGDKRIMGQCKLKEVH